MGFGTLTRGELYADIIHELPVNACYEVKIAFAVIDQAIRDATNGDLEILLEARAFITSVYFESWCDAAGLDFRVMRERLTARGVDRMV